MTPADVKRECGDRIGAALRDYETQLNILSYGLALALKVAAGGHLSSGERDAIGVLLDCQLWVATMRATADDLITRRTTDYASDAHWPPVPTRVRTFIDHF